MDALTIAQHYFDTSNRHDAASIVAAFAEGGTYSDPTTGGPLSAEAIAGYATGLWASFPDLAFEIVSAGLAGNGVVAAQWIMRGTIADRCWGCRQAENQLSCLGLTLSAFPMARSAQWRAISIPSYSSRSWASRRSCSRIQSARTHSAPQSP